MESLSNQVPNMSYTTSTSNISYAVFIAVLGVYHPIRWLIQKSVQYVNEDLYRKLKASGDGPFNHFFFSIMGMFINCIQVPACILALRDTPSETDAMGTERSFTTAGQICFAAPTASWVVEIPIAELPMVIHHTLSLVGFACLIANNAPRRPIYMLNAGMATMQITYPIRILKALGHTNSNSNIIRLLFGLHGLLYIFLRVPVSATAGIMSIVSLNRIQDWLMVVSIYLQVIYLAVNGLHCLRAAGVVELVWKQPAGLIIAQRLKVSLYSIMIGFAMAVGGMISMVTYSMEKENEITKQDIHILTLACFFGAVIGTVGLCSLAAVMPPSETECLRRIVRELYLECGIIFAGLWAAFASDTMGRALTRREILYSMVISMPIGEGISRIGCYFASYDDETICDSKSVKEKILEPLEGNVSDRRKSDGISSTVEDPHLRKPQGRSTEFHHITASIANLSAFAWIFARYATGNISLPDAALFSIAMHASIALLLKTSQGGGRSICGIRTAIYPQVNLSRLFSAIELFIAAIILLVELNVRSLHDLYLALSCKIGSSGLDIFWFLGSIIGLLLLVFGTRPESRQKVAKAVMKVIERPALVVCILGVAIGILGIESAMRPDHRKNAAIVYAPLGFRNVRLLMLDPVFAACIISIGLIPIACINGLRVFSR
jgi:hypothetical protein